MTKWTSMFLLHSLSKHCYLTSLASITVATPTVRAIFGTLDMSSSKNRAFAKIVSLANVLTRVRDTSDDPGSLNAI